MTAQPKPTLAPSAPTRRHKSALPQPSHNALSLVETALQNLKAQHILTLNLAGKTSLADHMVIATGTSSRHLASLADLVADTLTAAQPHPYPVLGRDGDASSDWICLDLGDIIVHLFLPEARATYNLEKLWSHTFKD